MTVQELDFQNKILLGDARQIMSQLPESRFACLKTSPPYALSVRKYTDDNPNEIGREDDIDTYLDALIEVAKHGKRILYPWAVQVWNIGDRFKDKRQLRIPEKFSDRMEEIGYYRFDEVIWYKKNGNPSSTLNHFKPDFEKVMFFAREDQDDYFFDLKAVKVPLAESTVDRYEYGCGNLNRLELSGLGEGVNMRHSRKKIRFGGDKHAGKNENNSYSGNAYVKAHDGMKVLGSVWEISPQLERFAYEYCPNCDALRARNEMWKRCGKCKAYRFDNDEICPACQVETIHDLMCAKCDREVHSHWAQFPLELVRRIVKSCCPQYICSQCGRPRKPTYKDIRIDTRPGIDTNNGRGGSSTDPNGGLHSSDWSKKRQTSIAEPIGFEATCSCNAKWINATSIDPFMGWGTSAEVCLEQGRFFTGIDINPLNIKAAYKRLEPMLAIPVLDNFIG